MFSNQVIRQQPQRGVFSNVISASGESTFTGNLIIFLAVAQEMEVELLPFSWLPGLSSLGEGASGKISQTIVTTDEHFAFKRFQRTKDPAERYASLISELLILSQPPISEHPNVIALKGISWDIEQSPDEATPVLVFEKAPRDLERYVRSEEGGALSFKEKLSLLADIGRAVVALHDSGVIHGDIKPSNILIFQNPHGKIKAKIADFGYSSLTADKLSLVTMPRSRPWNAPEHTFDLIDFQAARKMDLYSFGMVCLWLLLGDAISHHRMAKGEIITFQTPFSDAASTALEEVKANGALQMLAINCVKSLANINEDEKNRFCTFFSLTLAHEPDNRVNDLKQCMDSLCSNYLPELQLKPKRLAVLDECKIYQKFNIIASHYEYIRSHFLVRTQIFNALKDAYWENISRPFAPAMARELATTYLIGFGVMRDISTSEKWLRIWTGEHASLKHDLMPRMIQEMNVRRKRLKYEWAFSVQSLVYEYRVRGQQQFKDILNLYNREAKDVSQAFGEVHGSTLTLFEIIGEILDELQEFEESKQLRKEIAQKVETAYGTSNVLFENAISGLAGSYERLGEYDEAERLRVLLVQNIRKNVNAKNVNDMIKICNLATIYAMKGNLDEAQNLYEIASPRLNQDLGYDHPLSVAAVSNIAGTSLTQGQYDKAEHLYTRVAETRKEVLGSDHPNTLEALADLAKCAIHNGHYEDAEAILIKIQKDSVKVLGEEHLKTLQFMSVRAGVLWNRGRWGEAENLNRRIVDVWRRTLGPEHPHTLLAMTNLAAALSAQGRWKEAENQISEVRNAITTSEKESDQDALASLGELAVALLGQQRYPEAEKLLKQSHDVYVDLLGVAHPSTLVQTNNLTFCYCRQEKFDEAAAIQPSVVELATRKLGPVHPDTLRYKAQLALVYQGQDCWEETLQLEQEVLSASEKALGKEHPDTMSAIANLAATYISLEKWESAVEMYERLMQLSAKLHGKNYEEKGSHLAFIALAYAHLGRMEEALKCEKEAENILGMQDG